jgi:hypothetical protein
LFVSPASLCHVLHCPPCPLPPAFLYDSIPPPSPHSGTLPVPCLVLGCDAILPRVSHTWCCSNFFYWFIFLFLFLLSAFLLWQVTGAPLTHNMSRGPLFSWICARSPLPSGSFFHFFSFCSQLTTLLPSQAHWGPLLFTNTLCAMPFCSWMWGAYASQLVHLHFSFSFTDWFPSFTWHPPSCPCCVVLPSYCAPSSFLTSFLVVLNECRWVRMWIIGWM